MCRSADNQFRFDASQERCHATWRLVQAQSAQGGDDVSKQATAWSAHLKQN